MSDSQSPMALADNGDPAMQQAYASARGSFRFFWREVVWDRKRIVPALGLAGVKAPFTDGEPLEAGGSTPWVEHMWLSGVDFDGRFVTGTLANTPNRLKSVREGDGVRFAIDQISDWMYAIGGDVYGGYTVNLLRSRMSASERERHDSAWGLKFGDPLNVRTVGAVDYDALSANAAASLREYLVKQPSLLSAKGLNGWTLLHQDASAGSTATVRVLLDAGADPTALTDNGLTALQLARVLGWDSVVVLLENSDKS